MNSQYSRVVISQLGGQGGKGIHHSPKDPCPLAGRGVPLRGPQLRGRLPFLLLTPAWGREDTSLGGRWRQRHGQLWQGAQAESRGWLTCPSCRCSRGGP